MQRRAWAAAVLIGAIVAAVLVWSFLPGESPDLQPEAHSPLPEAPAVRAPTEPELIDALADSFEIRPADDELQDFVLSQQPQLRSDAAFSAALEPARLLIAALEEVQAGVAPAQALEAMNTQLERPMRDSVWQVHLDQLSANPDYLAQRKATIAVSREDTVASLVGSPALADMYLENRLRLKICGLPEVQDRITAAIRRKGIPDHAMDKNVITHHCIIESREWYLDHARERGFKGGQFEDSDLALFASADVLREMERQPAQ